MKREREQLQWGKKRGAIRLFLLSFEGPHLLRIHKAGISRFGEITDADFSDGGKSPAGQAATQGGCLISYPKSHLEKVTWLTLGELSSSKGLFWSFVLSGQRIYLPVVLAVPKQLHTLDTKEKKALCTCRVTREARMDDSGNKSSRRMSGATANRLSNSSPT